MSPDTQTKPASQVSITPAGVEWAYGLGQRYRDTTLGYVGLRADKVCPFREGTKHRVCWYAAWRKKPIPWAIIDSF